VGGSDRTRRQIRVPQVTLNEDADLQQSARWRAWKGTDVSASRWCARNAVSRSSVQVARRGPSAMV
jgi:hypothetical protein